MTEFDDDKQAMVLRLERSSVHDGDGFRTVVFLKGCPLRCQWCSTPESQSFEIERTKEMVYGMPTTVEAVMKEVRKDSLFFFHSGGGMTLSGGEPLAQAEFSTRLLAQARQECIHTALETSLFAKPETVDAVLPYVNLLLADLKFADEKRHKRFCGVSNELILTNLRNTKRFSGSTKLVVRIPLIPTLNDDEEELERMGKVCAGLRHLSHIQLLPYHRLGSDTYRKLGRDYPLGDIQPPTDEQMQNCRAILERYVPRVI